MWYVLFGFSLVKGYFLWARKSKVVFLSYLKIPCHRWLPTRPFSFCCPRLPTPIMTSAQQLEGMQCLQALQNTVGETWGKWEWAQHFFFKGHGNQTWLGHQLWHWKHHQRNQELMKRSQLPGRETWRKCRWEQGIQLWLCGRRQQGSGPGGRHSKGLTEGIWGWGEELTQGKQSNALTVS